MNFSLCHQYFVTGCLYFNGTGLSSSFSLKYAGISRHSELPRAVLDLLSFSGLFTARVFIPSEPAKLYRRINSLRRLNEKEIVVYIKRVRLNRLIN